MDSYYLEEVLKSLSEKQQLMSDTLSEALLKSENEDEKKEIQKVLDYNEKIKEAINKKDLNSLQKIYSDASTNF
jgi:hypothetical protein